MPGEDILVMRKVELRKLEVIRKINEGFIKQKVGAEFLDLSSRQVRRLQKRVKENGSVGIIHGNRGKKSPRKFGEKFKEKILVLRREKYYDFQPKFMSEKLEEEGIQISKESLRQILIESGDWQIKVKKKKHRKWRERKECFGEMVQLDGSIHPWLEERGPELVLMKFVDDATSKSFGRFYTYEGTTPAMDLTVRYIKKHGIMREIYTDKHTTYRALREATIEEQLRGEKPQSSFQRAAKEIGIHIIHANSPQAKGRVERNFRTDQDRLVKELRLANVYTLDEANTFLESYWPKHNRQFAVKPMKEQDLHLQVPEGVKLSKVFREREIRTVRNDNTVQYNTVMFQIASNRHLYGKNVYVETDLKGKLFITYRSEELNFTKIDPEKIRKPEKKLVKVIKRRIPASKHPWRRYVVRAAETEVRL
jgi:hypothetical protein